jgi:hypothetical protein
MHQYLIRHPGGHESGPHSSEELLAMVAAGRVARECMIRRVGGPDRWHAAGTIAGLKFPAPTTPHHSTAVPGAVAPPPIPSVPPPLPFTAADAPPALRGSTPFGAVMALMPRAFVDPFGTVDRLTASHSEGAMFIAGCLLHLGSSAMVLVSCWLAIPEYVRYTLDASVGDLFYKGLVGMMSFLAAMTLANIVTRLFFSHAGRARMGLDTVAAALTLLPINVCITAAIFVFRERVTRTADEANVAMLLTLTYGVIMSTVLAYAISHHLRSAGQRVLIFITPVQLIGTLIVGIWIIETLLGRS